MHCTTDAVLLRQEEVSHDYLGYKLAAMECEKRFSEQRKLQHKMLLNKIEEIDYKLKVSNLCFLKL